MRCVKSGPWVEGLKHICAGKFPFCPRDLKYVRWLEAKLRKEEIVLANGAIGFVTLDIKCFSSQHVQNVHSFLDCLVSKYASLIFDLPRTSINVSLALNMKPL